MIEKEQFELLARRVMKESQRFENRVFGNPFIPNKYNVEMFHKDTFIEHCKDLDSLHLNFSGNDQYSHYCWMIVKNTYSHLSYGNEGFNCECVERKEIEAASYGKRILSSINVGFILTDSSILRKEVQLPSLIIIYYVPKEPKNESFFQCLVCSIISPESGNNISFNELQKKLKDIEYDFFSLHLINGFEVSKQEEKFELIKALSIQFQREWGNQEMSLSAQLKNEESKKTLRSNISHDLCHSLYEGIGRTRRIKDILSKKNINHVLDEETSNNILEEVLSLEQYLTSIFGVPWMMRMVDVHQNEFHHTRVNRQPNFQDAVFWSIKFQYIFNCIVLDRKQISRNIVIDYSFYAPSLELKIEESITGELMMEKKLRVGLKHLGSIWPFETEPNDTMQYEGEMATISSPISEMLRNSVKYIQKIDTKYFKEKYLNIKIEITMDSDDLIFYGTISNFLSAEQGLTREMNKVPDKLMKAFGNLEVVKEFDEDQKQLCYKWGISF